MKNKVNLLGNVGKDPETKVKDNFQFTNLSLATSKTIKNKDGEKITSTQWHNLVFYNNLSKVVQKFVKKGDKIDIEGEIIYRDYTDKEGNKKYITEIRVISMLMLGGKKEDLPEGDIKEPNKEDIPF